MTRITGTSSDRAHTGFNPPNKEFRLAFQVKDQDLYVDQDLYGSRVPTETEMRVISLVADGMKNHEVANVIGTTDHVVRNMLRTIFDKTGVWNRTELSLWYVAHLTLILKGYIIWIGSLEEQQAAENGSHGSLGYQ